MKLYLWICWDSGILECYPVEKYILREGACKRSYFYFEFGNKTKCIAESDLEQFKYGRILSRSNDYNYIKGVVSKSLFKKMLDAQEKYKSAEVLFTRFRQMNG